MLQTLFRGELRRLCGEENYRSAEQDLLIEVLCQAIVDLTGKSKRDSFRINDRGRNKTEVTIDRRADAEYFFDSHRLDPFAMGLDCEADEIRAIKDRLTGPETAKAVRAYSAKAEQCVRL
jgi:hypothetical protein